MEIMKRTASLRKRDIDPDLPDLQTQNKQKIPWIMMLMVVGTPQYKPNGEFFDGKVGLFPYIQKVPAQRSSKNRARGTMEIKPEKSTAEQYRNLLTKRGGVFDTISEKMEVMNI
jgi:hypothetical protein